jgi:hypothetical protein
MGDSRTSGAIVLQCRSTSKKETKRNAQESGECSMRVKNHQRRASFPLCRLLAVGLAAAFLCGLMPSVVHAQNATTNKLTPQMVAWTNKEETSSEITFTGIIKEVAKKLDKSPREMNLEVSGTTGATLVNVGPFLNSDQKSALAVGQSVQMSGIVALSKGRAIFLAREIQVADQTITIRNKYGFLVQPSLKGADTYQGHKGVGSAQ